MKMSYFKNEEQEGKTGPVWGLVPMGGGDIRKGCRGWIWWKYYVLMYENEKMRPVETTPGMRGRKNEGKW
jgi:hypothetical protein